METPKKPLKKSDPSESTGAKKSDDEETDDLPVKKRVIDDDEDDFDIPLDDLGRYESFEPYDDDDDF